MGLYEIPAIFKPKIKVLGWTIPIAYVEERRSEYIMDVGAAPLYVEKTVEYYEKYYWLGMGLDLRGVATREKVTIDENTRKLVPIEILILRATGNKTLGTLQGNFNMLGKSGIDFINKVYNTIGAEYARTISKPTAWLVYIPSKRLLTRLAWVRSINGKIVIRPFGDKNIMLEVESVELEFDLNKEYRKMAAFAALKEELNKQWDIIISRHELASALDELNKVAKEIASAELPEESEIGEVE